MTPDWSVALTGRTIITWNETELPDCGELYNRPVCREALKDVQKVNSMQNRVSKRGVSISCQSCASA